MPRVRAVLLAGLAAVVAAPLLAGCGGGDGGVTLHWYVGSGELRLLPGGRPALHRRLGRPLPDRAGAAAAQRRRAATAGRAPAGRPGPHRRPHRHGRHLDGRVRRGRLAAAVGRRPGRAGRRRRAGRAAGDRPLPRACSGPPRSPATPSCSGIASPAPAPPPPTWDQLITAAEALPRRAAARSPSRAAGTRATRSGSPPCSPPPAPSWSPTPTGPDRARAGLAPTDRPGRRSG